MFRVVGTLAGQILMRDNALRKTLSVTPTAKSEQLPHEELLESLAGSWFSTSRSTEAMISGTLNEGAVLFCFFPQTLCCRDLQSLYTASKNAARLACSPDAVALIDFTQLMEANQEESTLHSLAEAQHAQNVVLGTVNIKMSGADSTLQSIIAQSTSSLICCNFGDSTCNR